MTWNKGLFCSSGDIWLSVNDGHTPLEKWQAKIRRLRQYLRGWAKNVSGAYKKEKKTLLEKLDELDKKAETMLLTSQEVNLKHVLNERLDTVSMYINLIILLIFPESIVLLYLGW